MKNIHKIIIFSFIFLLLFNPTTRTYASEPEITAELTIVSNHVLIEGMVLSEGINWVTVLVYDGNEKIVHVGSTITNSRGKYAIAFLLEEDADIGTYTVRVNSENAISPVSENFIYDSENVFEVNFLTADAYFVNNRLNIEGRTDSGANKWVTVLVTDPNDSICYVSSVISNQNSEFRFSFLVDATSLLGTYTIMLNGEEATQQKIITANRTNSITAPDEDEKIIDKMVIFKKDMVFSIVLNSKELAEITGKTIEIEYDSNYLELQSFIKNPNITVNEQRYGYFKITFNPGISLDEAFWSMTVKAKKAAETNVRIIIK